MNLKEAFRYQNKLDEYIERACEIMGDSRNILKVKDTYLRSKAVAGAENETMEAPAPFEQAEHITELADFTVELVGEKEKLYEAIKAAKRAAPIDIDTEASLNSQRHRLAGLFQSMLRNKSGEEILPHAGTGYCMNVEGNQVQYRCDIRRVTTINFDRRRIQARMKELNRQADQVSARIDEAVITARVDYAPRFDVNDSFEDAFGAWLDSRRPEGPAR